MTEFLSYCSYKIRLHLFTRGVLFRKSDHTTIKGRAMLLRKLKALRDFAEKRQ